MSQRNPRIFLSMWTLHRDTDKDNSKSPRLVTILIHHAHVAKDNSEPISNLLEYEIKFSKHELGELLNLEKHGLHGVSNELKEQLVELAKNNP
ncbi:90_t:CDS:2 [Entrophospora sp. SA101]|nr:90_t:CDS:2 [Entrophospora sp. SA101]